MLASEYIPRFIAERSTATFLGAGVTREVFTLPSVPGVVFKVAKHASHRETNHGNKTEWDFWQRYGQRSDVRPFVAPCIAISEDFSILVMQRANPVLNDNDEFKFRIQAPWAGDVHRSNLGYITNRIVAIDYAIVHPQELKPLPALPLQAPAWLVRAESDRIAKTNFKFLAQAYDAKAKRAFAKGEPNDFGRWDVQINREPGVRCKCNACRRKHGSLPEWRDDAQAGLVANMPPIDPRAFDFGLMEWKDLDINRMTIRKKRVRTAWKAMHGLTPAQKARQRAAQRVAERNAQLDRFNPHAQRKVRR